ncbi:MAG: biotin--[acetyl-CoA-carboxylase] ligase [Nitrospirales bacterium]|nr:MAG: biotin--[acetyl-CoA-carboxylase] ligase [Nitrospirales bacterium]
MLSTNELGRPTLIFDEVSSTNTLGFEAAQRHTPHGTVILAESQTAGKGRLGRTWHSPSGKNLYVSIVLTHATYKTHISWIPLVTGMALAESLELVSELSLSLKWPNDIVIHDRKLAGILCEARQKGNTEGAIVVGIGMNINSDNDDFPKELRDTATSLKLERLQEFDRLPLLAAFLANLESHYTRLHSEPIEAIRSQYIARCSTLQCAIEVHFSSGKRLEGEAVDVGMDGELQVMSFDNQNRHTILPIRSGDVFHIRKSLRGIYNAGTVE